MTSAFSPPPPPWRGSAPCSCSITGELIIALEVAPERHEGAHGLPRVLVGLADHGVYAPDHPEVAVPVLAGGVADEVHVRTERGEVGLLEAPG